MKITSAARPRAVAAVAAALLTVAGLSACGSGSGGDLDEVQSVTFPGDYYISDVVAEEKGFFEDEGLKVNFIKPQSGTTSTQLMESGQVALMISDGVLTLGAQDKGLGIDFVGSVYNRSAWNIYVSDGDPDLEGTAADNPQGIEALKGKKIGVTGLGAGTDLALQAVLQENGLDPEKDVKRIGVGLLTSALGQLQNGGVDAYVYGPPADDLLGKDELAHRYYSVLDGPEESANVVQGGMLASTKWLEEGNNRDIAERWVAAHEKALAWVADPANLEEAGELFAEAFGGSASAGAEAVENLVETVYPHNLDGLKVPRAEFENSTQALTNLGMLKGSGPSYEDAVDEMGQE